MQKLILTTALVGLTAPAFAQSTTTKAEAEAALANGECIPYLVEGTNYYNFVNGSGCGLVAREGDGDSGREERAKAAAEAAKDEGDEGGSSDGGDEGGSSDGGQ